MELKPLYINKGFKLAIPYTQIKVGELQLINEPSIDGDRQEVLIDIVKNEALCIALIEKQNKELNEKIKS